MADLYEVLKEAADKVRPPRVWPKILGTACVTTVLLCVLAFFVSIIYREYYQNKVYPGVYVGSVSLGGLTKQEVKQFIESVNNRLAKEGLTLSITTANGEIVEKKLDILSDGDDAIQLVELNSTDVAVAAFVAGRPTGWRAYVSPLLMRTFMPKNVVAPVAVAPPLRDVLAAVLAPYENAPHNARVVFASPNNLANFTVEAEKQGYLVDKSVLIKKIQTQLGALSFDSIAVVPHAFMPTVDKSDVENNVSLLPRIFASGDIELNYINPNTKQRHDWKITPATFSGWLEFRKNDDGTIVVGIEKEHFIDYLDRNIRPLTDTPAQNAKFVIEDGKVQEFQGSKNGLGVNAEKTYQDVDIAFSERTYIASNPTKTITIGLDITEPDIKTADVNTLGITEVVGVGVSTFYGSHTNRIKNLTTAVKRLNGTLIKPGEIFSANKFAGPYTPENGFYEELVIKGDRIVKEVGGGMCQIGTTLFRMAMNTGLDITERRNHSLVVSYYADPVNGNPGTDATLYDPVLDLKFVNDTGNYLLLQTDIDYKKQQLTFTLWGKPDGRKGWYTHPTVSKWIPPGETVEIPDTQGKVPAGSKECQEAYRGAVASFTYSRVLPTGEKVDRVFDSYYRALPKICIVGGSVASSTVALPLGEPGQ